MMTKTIEQEAQELERSCALDMGVPSQTIRRDKFWSHETLCRVLEQLRAEREANAATKAEFEAFRQEVSDAVEHYLDQWRDHTPSREVFTCQFAHFIIPEPVDPLVEAVRDCGYATLDAIEPEFVADLRTALAKRGLKLVEAGDAAA